MGPKNIWNLAHDAPDRSVRAKWSEEKRYDKVNNKIYFTKKNEQGMCGCRGVIVMRRVLRNGMKGEGE